jgi:hypothetical protein
MILGLILTIIGSLLVVRNRDLALLLNGNEYSRHLMQFNNTVARQNIAVIGGLVFASGLALIVCS